MARVIALVALLAVLAAAFVERPYRPLSLVLISVDTLRPDRLGIYGYARATAPAIDAFARERAVVFENVVSVSSWTLLPCQLVEELLLPTPG